MSNIVVARWVKARQVVVLAFSKFACSLTAIVILFGLAGPSVANDLRIANLQFVWPRETKGEARAIFDVTWENAWHNSRNHDAAWIFLKFVGENGYSHVVLAPDGHRVLTPAGEEVPAQIDLAKERTGLFVYPADPYRGEVQWRLSVRLDPETFDDRFRNAILEVFGTEMVYVPEGPFTLGDPDSTALKFGAFYKSDSGGEPDGLVRITSEDEIGVGPSTGQLYYRKGQYQGDRQGPVPAAFPKGFRAFYVMKYEITQGEYAAFLNTLYDDATFERFHFGGRSYFKKRGTIRLGDDRYVAERSQRPINFITWDDGLAFADWAALRPMTEMEFTKACRGSERPKPGAFPWGTASRDQLARNLDRHDDLVMLNGWDESKLSDETRPVFGASFYWVLDLAGSVWERVITIGQPDGRQFTGSHGDGKLGSRMLKDYSCFGVELYHCQAFTK